MILIGVLSGAALILGIIALTLAVTLARRVAERDPSALPGAWRSLLRVKWSTLVDVPEMAEHRNGQRVAFVANPTKAGVAQIRERAVHACSVRYLPQPMWFHTSPDDAGASATRAAIDAGADTVIAIGGDGTVRAAAQELAGTEVALGIIPIGTGNLFARNMDLPIDNPGALIAAALDGPERRVDVGRLTLGKSNKEHVFLIIGGVGIDADMVAGADASMKRRFGWIAYFLSAIKHLRDTRMSATVTVDDEEPVTSKMRTVLFGNVGKLPGGLQLIPEASAEDGYLDVLTMDARGGIVGWTELFGNVIAQSAVGTGAAQPSPFLREIRTSRLDHARAQTVAVSIDEKRRVQVDGEELGFAKRVTAWVEPSSLTVRVAP